LGIIRYRRNKSYISYGKNQANRHWPDGRGQRQQQCRLAEAAFDGDNDQIVLTAENNPTLENRMALIAIATGVVRDTLEITQQGMTFDIESLSASIPSNDETTVAVNINHSQDVTIRARTAGSRLHSARKATNC